MKNSETCSYKFIFPDNYYDEGAKLYMRFTKLDSVNAYASYGKGFNSEAVKATDDGSVVINNEYALPKSGLVTLLPSSDTVEATDFEIQYWVEGVPTGNIGRIARAAMSP
jgi:hypothetical protein